MGLHCRVICDLVRNTQLNVQWCIPPTLHWQKYKLSDDRLEHAAMIYRRLCWRLSNHVESFNNWDTEEILGWVRHGPT